MNAGPSFPSLSFHLASMATACCRRVRSEAFRTLLEHGILPWKRDMLRYHGNHARPVVPLLDRSPWPCRVLIGCACCDVRLYFGNKRVNLPIQTRAPGTVPTCSSGGGPRCSCDTTRTKAA
jgi:hypothetical protein